MRIGIEAQRILRKKKHGMDMVALQLIKSLQHVAPEHEYVVFVRPGDDDAVLQNLTNVELVYVKSLSYADWEQIWLPLAILKSKVEVMHFTSNTAPYFCPVPYVLILHDIIFMENRSLSKSWYQRLGAIYRRAIVPHAVRKAMKIVTVSLYELEKIAFQFPLAAMKLKVIYNAASEVFTDKIPIDTSGRFHHLPKKFFLFLGNADPKKNTANVLKAYIFYREKLNGQLPLVVGDYPRELIKKTLAESNDLYLIDDIISMGYLTQTELSFLYHKATAFLYPSLRESFGIPIIEAMQSGCPVITSNTSSMPEVAKNAAFLVDPTEPIDIGNAMNVLAHDENYRIKLIKRGLLRAGDFNWDFSARQYLNLYKEIELLKMKNQLLFIQN